MYQHNAQLDTVSQIIILDELHKFTKYVFIFITIYAIQSNADTIQQSPLYTLSSPLFYELHSTL